MKRKVMCLGIIGILFFACIPVLNAGAIETADVDYDVDISCNVNLKRICLGQTASFQLVVTNTGDYNDTYDIGFPKYIIFESTLGWIYRYIELSHNNVSLEPGESTVVYCNVTIFDSYQDLYEIMIYAMSRTNRSVTDVVNLYIKILSQDVHVSALGGLGKLDIIIENIGEVYLMNLKWNISVEGLNRNFIDVGSEGEIVGMWPGECRVVNLPRGSIKRKFGFVKITVHIEESVLGRNPLHKTVEFYGFVFGRMVKIIPILPGPRPIPLPEPIID